MAETAIVICRHGTLGRLDYPMRYSASSTQISNLNSVKVGD